MKMGFYGFDFLDGCKTNHQASTQESKTLKPRRIKVSINTLIQPNSFIEFFGFDNFKTNQQF
ncbi:hypothetical protein AAX09_05260 [Moraxella bovoculi]|nr:hypothetical protein AAX10_05105 [Moraxella bovoculi]AKG18885.1 hypothetical protein AAX09_05260 [Moraxella bovoculi]